MNVTSTPAPDVASAPVLTPDQLLRHWQGHRALTRRVIEAFPEEQLVTFSIGGMRPFGALVMEMLSVAAPMVRGFATGEWEGWKERSVRPKAELLRLWDEATEQLNAEWPRIAPARFQETVTAFGLYTDTLVNLVLYAVDNEVHHRGQGYVYLRALGIEPPPFYERG